MRVSFFGSPVYSPYVVLALKVDQNHFVLQKFISMIILHFDQYWRERINSSYCFTKLAVSILPVFSALESTALVMKDLDLHIFKFLRTHKGCSCKRSCSCSRIETGSYSSTYIRTITW